MAPTAEENTTTAGTDSRGASVLVNAIEVLRCFSVEEPLLGVTEIASRVGLHKSTVSRILATLEQEDLVERDETSRRFKLGLGLIAVAGPLLAELDERRVAYPVLRELTERTQETSALVTWTGSSSVCVEQIPSPQQVKHTSPLGARYRTALSASVQVFLAAEEPERVRALLAGGVLEYPSPTPARIEEFIDRLKRVAAEGCATNYGETSVDEVGIAAPVHDHRGNIIAAVMIAAPRFRVSPEHLGILAGACTAAARQVTARMGGTTPQG
ncbi:IclR family transcriptional regulator [Arthrobacter mobilis]|uniref:Glycerol operon regulatory protein n=1 Tax=Arthrobacter mobilis TaxID=2724944 RepID=A0A7X6K7P7_9MICC|nr:IclR family transcriptional regulator [Arthrobacter mobilis]NKX56685.1 IclR family transcriptional regulator [Arthrobacter mobilis]